MSKKTVCGAKTRSGGTCKRAPAKGSNRCRLHGGASLIGPASGTFKHGRYSKLLPENIRVRYEKALDDPDLLSLREQIALTEAREADLVERLKPNTETTSWTRARNVFKTLLTAMRGGDEELLRGSVAEMRVLMDEGARIEGVWRELFNVQEHLRRLKEGERRRLEALQQTITAQQAFTLLAAILDVVRRHVSDRAALSSIAREVKALTERGEVE